jgi:hypothetical protein
MKPISLLLSAILIMLGAAAGAAPGGDTDRTTCHSDSGKCPPPPAPPAPPAAPAPPAPPPLPPLPAIPAAAHAACAAKTAGTSLTWVIGKRETMTGTCAREAGKMVFVLQSYALED